MIGQWWGYQSVVDCDMAWGARAIFKPSSNYPLDLLPDRQGHQFEESQQEDFKVFCDFLNKQVIPTLQELTAYFDTSNTNKFVWHFEWPTNTTKIVVAQGSPNGSYGYFYLSVSLVDRDKAPEIIRPVGYLTPEEQRVAQEQRESQRRLLTTQSKQFNKGQRAKTRKIKEGNAALLEHAEFKAVGDVLVASNRILVEANQGKRDAMVLKVIGNEALISYFMPNGKTFLRIINATTQHEIRSVSEKGLPKKWQ